MSSAAGNSQTQADGAAPMVHPALPGPNALMVQVAAVSHQEDASVLVGALRNRGYVASAQRDPSDELIHVRIGPFTNRDDANRTARKLLDDGYNAMVQP
jgi:cell division septation protein DedD